MIPLSSHGVFQASSCIAGKFGRLVGSFTMQPLFGKGALGEGRPDTRKRRKSSLVDWSLASKQTPGQDLKETFARQSEWTNAKLKNWDGIGDASFGFAGSLFIGKLASSRL